MHRYLQTVQVWNNLTWGKLEKSWGENRQNWSKSPPPKMSVKIFFFRNFDAGFVFSGLHYPQNDAVWSSWVPPSKKFFCVHVISYRCLDCCRNSTWLFGSPWVFRLGHHLGFSHTLYTMKIMTNRLGLSPNPLQGAEIQNLCFCGFFFFKPPLTARFLIFLKNFCKELLPMV